MGLPFWSRGARAREGWANLSREKEEQEQVKKKKKKTENEIASVVQDVEELKSSYSADGNDGLKCCSHYGKLFGHPTEY